MKRITKKTTTTTNRHHHQQIAYAHNKMTKIKESFFSVVIKFIALAKWEEEKKIEYINKMYEYKCSLSLSQSQTGN